MKALLESPSRDVRIATLQYVQALHDSKYLLLISPLIRDPDMSVAAEARRTKDALESKAH